MIELDAAIINQILDKFSNGKMKRLMKEHGLTNPELFEEGNFFVVKFYGPGEKILDLVPSIPKKRQLDLRELGLNKRQIEALRLMVNEKKVVSNKEYRERFNVTDRTALRDLNLLLSKNMIKKKGFKKNALYFAK